MIHLDFSGGYNLGIFSELFKDYERQLGVIARGKFNLCRMQRDYSGANSIVPSSREELHFSLKIKNMLERNTGIFVFIFTKLKYQNLMLDYLSFLPHSVNLITYKNPRSLNYLVRKYEIHECIGYDEHLQYISEEFLSEY
jgi:hypothetical protein